MPINTIILRKHLVVCSESTECQNTINCSLNHYTVKCCNLDCFCNFSSPRDICSLYKSWAISSTKYGHVLYSGTMLSHSMPSRHYISIIMHLKKCCNYNPFASEGQGNLLTFCSKLVTYWYTMAYMFSATSLYKPVLCSIRITEFCVTHDYIHWIFQVVRNWSQSQSLENYCVVMCQLSVQLTYSFH